MIQIKTLAGTEMFLAVGEIDLKTVFPFFFLISSFQEFKDCPFEKLWNLSSFEKF